MKVEFNQREKKVLLFFFLAIGVILAISLISFKGQTNFLNPLLGKILGGSRLGSGVGEEILGTAQEIVAQENLEKVFDGSSQVWEESPLAQPVQVIREVVVEKVNQTIETVKELPEQEIKKIKKEICQEWLEEE